MDLIGAVFANRRRRRRQVVPVQGPARRRHEDEDDDDDVPLIPTGRGALRTFLLAGDLAESDESDEEYLPSTPPEVSEESDDGEPETDSDDD